MVLNYSEQFALVFQILKYYIRLLYHAHIIHSLYCDHLK